MYLVSGMSTVPNWNHCMLFNLTLEELKFSKSGAIEGPKCIRIEKLIIFWLFRSLRTYVVIVIDEARVR